MARMFPREIPNRLRKEAKSQAEIKMYDLLKKQLPDDWTVFYSVPWLGRVEPGQAPRDGETDFIITHRERGILLIEVKGGRIRYDGSTRRWISIDRNDNEHDLHEGPFQQAMKCKKALLEKIKTFPGYVDQWMNLAHAVAFPDALVRNVALPLEAATEVIIDGSHLDNLEKRIEEILSFARSKRRQGGREDWSRLISHIEDRLAKVTELPNPLSLAIEDEQREILRLTEEQFKFLDFVSRHRRAAFSGCAGSGKTLMAAEKVRRLAKEGLRTLFTCYNEPLARHLAQALRDLPGVHVATFREVCSDLASQAGVAGAKQVQDAPDADLADYLSNALAKRPDLKYEAIIVDEGQDFLEVWWVALEEALVDARSSFYYIFYDDNQRVYPHRGQIPEPNEYPLHENLRNTRAIFNAIKPFYEGNPSVRPRGPSGRDVEQVKLADPNDLEKTLSKLVNRLCTTESVHPREVVVLTARTADTTVLSKLKLEGGFRLVHEPAGHQKEILYSPLHDYKGLECSIAIVVELEEALRASEADRNALFYVAFSRPRNHLILVAAKATMDDVMRHLR